jgi:methyltransferase (TIGR00027 family)
MDRHTPSLTAEIIAAHRAIESRKPKTERICFDPLAERFVSPDVGVLGRVSLPEDVALSRYEAKFPGFHTYFAVRTRYIDDFLSECLNDGFEQIVILGAGYDSRAYRIERLREPIRVFEVDHPATQARKTETLREMLDTLPGHVVLVGMDFNTDDLHERLAISGYVDTAKSLFIWEGVTYYLTAEAVDATLGFIVRYSGKGSAVIFDYTSRSVIDGTSGHIEAMRWHEQVKKAGEPLSFGIDFEDLEAFLLNRGFDRIRNATCSIFREAYLTGPNRHRSITPVVSIVQAFV